jgi:hypothetical protein
MTPKEYEAFAKAHAASIMPVPSPHPFMAQAWAVYRETATGGREIVRAGEIRDKPEPEFRPDREKVGYAAVP